MLEQTLQEIGLTKYESQIYLALLELGESTTSSITKKIGTHIGRIYELLETLKEKGLVSEIKKDGVKYYTALSPEKLLDYISEKSKVLKTHEELITSTLEKFTLLQSQRKNDPHIEIFTGLEGIKSALQKEMQLYADDTEVLVFGVKPVKAYSKALISFFQNKVYRERIQHNVKVRKINNSNPQIDDYSKETGSNIRYLDLNSSVTINVLKDLTTLTISYDPLICISIESADVAQGFKDQFENLWEIAKR